MYLYIYISLFHVYKPLSIRNIYVCTIHGICEVFSKILFQLLVLFSLQPFLNVSSHFVFSIDDIGYINILKLETKFGHMYVVCTVHIAPDTN
jgi:hypothetical protein